jgi:hypothetical protein
MNGDNTQWFSQTILTYKDKQYATDGYLRVSISTNTEDYKFFNPPIFNISITNQISKSCNLNIQNIDDLFESFTVALKQISGEDIVIEKNYQKGIKIYFQFIKATTTGERVVSIEMISSETDAVKVVVPVKPTFQSFLRRLRFFVENYDNICLNLLSHSINSRSTEILHQLPSLVKGISSQIVSCVPPEDDILDSCASKVDRESVKRTEGNIYDLDKFMGDDMSNIKIPELEVGEATGDQPIIEVESEFVAKYLGGDLYNLENKLTSFAVSPSPITGLATDIESVLEFKLMNGITDDDKKSIIYISTLFQNFCFKSYTINDQLIPSGTPTLKFKGKGDIKNLELAKDIAVLVGYMRTVRRRLESKIESAYDNKSIVYLYMRCMMDPFCFSYLDNLSRTDLMSAIETRYNYFDSIGLFDKYKQILTDNRCSEINSHDIRLYAEELIDTFIGKKEDIDVLHEKLFLDGKVRLPSKNTYNLEQIINEIIPVEVSEKLGADLKDTEVQGKIKDQFNISDEILQFFVGKQKSQKADKAKKITPLYRWVDKFKQDIPDQYREEVLEVVESLQYDTFNISKSPWPLDEFDERVVKALYLWQPALDEKMKANFEYFATLIENEKLSKENILTAVDSKQSTEWDDISSFV